VDTPLQGADLGLDPGQTAAILLAEPLHAELLLIDERAGKKVAASRGIANTFARWLPVWEATLRGD
jgi:predicted nucleic acid-binding protein